MNASENDGDLREAVGKVIARWYRVGLLRFNSHDDGSDDLLLRDEIVHGVLAALPSTPLADGRLDVERLRDAALLVLQSQRVSMRKRPLALAIALDALRVALASEDTP